MGRDPRGLLIGFLVLGISLAVLALLLRFFGEAVAAFAFCIGIIVVPAIVIIWATLRVLRSRTR